MNLSSVSNPTLSFAYHMYGASMGTMYLDIFTKGVWTNSIWSMTGDQGNSWKVANINLSNWAMDTVTFRWRGVTAGSQSDMALDAINLLVPATVDGARELRAAQRFRVFPNPATGEFNLIMAEQRASDLSYTITDVSGREILSGMAQLKSGDSSATIDMQQFAAGVYTLRLTCDGRVEYAKLYKI
jgi:hypothetical protein